MTSNVSESLFPGTITLERCQYSDTYTAQRYPTCGCKTCWGLWYAKARLRPALFEKLLDANIHGKFWEEFASFFHDR